MAKPLGRRTFGERLNFLLTNRLPRRWLTLFMGWFSKIENPIVRSLSMSVWRLFADDLRLEEARQTRFKSLHDCFVRELKSDARVIDEDRQVLVSPCDAVIGEFGHVENLQALQAKGFPYSLAELLGSEQRARDLADARYVTLRLKSSMYHHFHSPCDATLEEVIYISGDTWNVNPVALKTIERLFCRNERAVLQLQPSTGDEIITLVAVAAILVASIRVRGLSTPLNLRYRGPNRIGCGRSFLKGDPIGHFEHGSTVVMFVDGGYRFAESVKTGDVIRMGQALFRRRPDPGSLTVVDAASSTTADSDDIQRATHHQPVVRNP